MFARTLFGTQPGTAPTSRGWIYPDCLCGSILLTLIALWRHRWCSCLSGKILRWLSFGQGVVTERGFAVLSLEVALVGVFVTMAAVFTRGCLPE